MPKNNYKDLEKQTGIKFKSLELIKRAFVHKSYVNEHRDEDIKDNERLEFLGDAVLELATTHHLFEGYPDQDEGQMTAFRSALVKGKHLAQVARELKMGDYLFLSNGEERSGGREKNYILANVLEALIGAIYMEHGYTVAEKFIEKFILTKLDEIIEKGLHIDSKSQFQETCQEKEDVTPHYEVLDEEGPDHAKIFTMGAYIGEELIAKGKGSSKQKAEDEAARNALKAKGWE
ncbi:ribonuclease III [Candidatus Peregrinibacteria bacterium]|nr:ribonuclease III [Candidatus Peregrinibacteria bacterium]